MKKYFTLSHMQLSRNKGDNCWLLVEMVIVERNYLPTFDLHVVLQSLEAK